MKRSVSFLMCLLITQIAFCQIKWKNYSQTFDDKIFAHPEAVGIITATPAYNDFFRDLYANEPLKKYIASDLKFMQERANGFTAVNIFGAYPVYFFINGINPGNAARYEYRVSQNNGGESVWHAVTQFADPAIEKISGFPQMAYIGHFSLLKPGKFVIDLREHATGKIISTAVVYRIEVRPVLLNIYTANELDQFLKRLSEPGNYRLSPSDVKKWQQNYAQSDLDILTAMPKRLILKAPENGLIFYLKGKMTDRKQLEYQLEKNGKIDSTWRTNNFDNSFIWLKDLTPGSYHIKIRYAFNPSGVLDYPFDIQPTWYQSMLFKFATGTFIAICIGLLIIIAVQRKRASFETERRKKLQIDQQIISAQLNPHFIFNCLNSIQGLINNNDIEKANDYLTNFARLMRSTLLYSTRENIALQQELDTIELYLRLEQMRFNFSFAISIQETLNGTQIDVPAFLLQPVLENSIKHGIADLGDRGKLTISVSAEKSDILIELTDNGKGYDLKKEYNGFGLKLTKKRIGILNDVFKGKKIIFDVISGVSGTVSRIILKNWIDEH